MHVNVALPLSVMHVLHCCCQMQAHVALPFVDARSTCFTRSRSPVDLALCGGETTCNAPHFGSCAPVL